MAYHFHEPLGVVGQIIPWNFPILMAVWKLAPGARRRQLRGDQAGRTDPGLDCMFLFDIIGDLLPAGVVNIVNGFGIEAGAPLAQHKRIRKVAFTGETTTGSTDHAVRIAEPHPGDARTRRQEPERVLRRCRPLDERPLLRQGARGLHDVRAQSAARSAPARLAPSSSARSTTSFLADGLERVGKVVQGNPLDPATMIGAQASNDQLEKILSYIDIGKAGRCAKLLTGGERVDLGGDLSEGYYVAADRVRGHERHAHLPGGDLRPGRCRSPRSTASTTRSTIANDTLYGLGRRGVEPLAATSAYRAGRAIEAGRVWTNTYHQYPAHAAFGGYKQSGVGRENHKMMLDHYQQTKNLLVSYAEGPMGFF